jgi:predicted amidophosphoribosyltransferase
LSLTVDFPDGPAGRGQAGWDGDLYAAVDYLPGAGNSGDGGTQLVRRLKAGDPAASAMAARLILEGLAAREHQLRRGSPWIEIVAAPGHRSGPAGVPIHRLCLRLTAAAPWLLYRPGRLVRATAIRSSRTARQRPSVEEHLATLACSGRPAAGSIIIDDVFTRGNTSEACLTVLRERGAMNVAVACLAMAA